MPEMLQGAGRELPFILLLLALLGFRWRVTPKASLHIAAPPQKIFELLDLREGDTQRWQRTKVNCRLIEASTQTYRLKFTTALATGATQTSEADFRVIGREEPWLIETERAGLEGKPEHNQLLKMTAVLSPEAEGTRLKLAYYWGPRPLLAQLLARTDLWGSIYRLKGVAETGKPDYLTDALLSAGVAVATGIITLWTFAFGFGWAVAVLLVASLLVHEIGHLLAYRMIGQPWGRLVFLPFIGAVAVPRIGFATQAQSVFAALMGPAFSVALPLAAVFYIWTGAERIDVPVLTGIVAVALNLFNLLPVEPLDGGVILRSVLARVMGSWARFGMIASGIAITAVGWMTDLILLVIFGAIAVVANIRPRTIDPGLEPLSRLQVTIAAFSFMSVLAAYSVLLRYLLEQAAAITG